MQRSLNPRIQGLSQSAIRAMTIECAKVGGINLAQGICDTPVPDAVADAVAPAIAAGCNTYSRCEGTDELRQALADKMREAGLAYDAATEIVVTIGATGAFQVAATALLQPGDEVLVFEPFYGYHVSTLVTLGLVPRFVALEAESGWSLDAAALRAAVGPRTRAVIVNTPSNPCGKVFSRAELAEIGAVADAADLWIFTDEVYEHFVYDGHEHVSPASLPGLRERTVTMSSLSKTLSITGWRLGWMAADAPWARAFAQVNDLVYVCAPTPLQIAAAAGLSVLGPDYRTRLAHEHQSKRDRICAALTDAGLPPHVPEGAYYVLADASRLPGSSGMDRAMHLLARTGMATVPGNAFHTDGRGHELLRFCFGKTDADLDEACRRLREARLP
ncbi:MAG: pyridoxal phosphate-dependent aminotransferase [Candidatus Binatia bacterium]